MYGESINLKVQLHTPKSSYLTVLYLLSYPLIFLIVEFPFRKSFLNLYHRLFDRFYN